MYTHPCFHNVFGGFIICSLNWQRHTVSNSGYIFSVFFPGNIYRRLSELYSGTFIILDQDGLETLLFSVGVQNFSFTCSYFALHSYC